MWENGKREIVAYISLPLFRHVNNPMNGLDAMEYRPSTENGRYLEAHSVILTFPILKLKDWNQELSFDFMRYDIGKCLNIIMYYVSQFVRMAVYIATL